MMFAGTFAPRGWAYCDGQLLPISGNEALFSLLGTTYGGDGRTTFALPDLRGCVPVHPGTGPGRTTRKLGQKGGTEQNTLNVTQLPAHSHNAETTISGAVTIGVSRRAGSVNTPVNNVLAGSGAGINLYAPDSGSAQSLGGVKTELTAATQTESVGGNQPIDNMPPFVGIHYVIALVGLFPSRS